MSPDGRVYCVYIMASRSRVLYTGSTSNLLQRVYQHRHQALSSFTAKYNVNRLVWYECSRNSRAAVEMERAIKSWSRARKIRLIESLNHGWIDLATDWLPDRSAQDPSLRSG